MRRVTSYLTLILILLSASVARGQEKLFTEAIKNGRAATSLYSVVITSGKVVKEEDVLNFKSQYIIRNIKYQIVSRFGEDYKGVKSFEFLPFNEIPRFIFESKFNSGIAYKDIVAKNKGNVYFWSGTPMFKKYSGSSWTGTVSEGYVQGGGVGYFYDEEKNLQFFLRVLSKKEENCRDTELLQLISFQILIISIRVHTLQRIFISAVPIMTVWLS